MKTIENKNEQKSATFLDRSLYEWVPRSELAEIVPQIVRTVNHSTTPSAGSATRSDEVVLAVLVYCYAIGIYRSQEIEERVRRNQARSQSLLQAALDGKALAQYRRSHGQLLKQCLASALQQAFQVNWTKTRAGIARTDSNPGSALECEAERRLEVAEAWDLFDQEGMLGKSDRDETD